jgi:hypothetical protein
VLLLLLDIFVSLFEEVTFVICFISGYLFLMSKLYLTSCHYILCNGFRCQRHVIQLKLIELLPQKEYANDETYSFIHVYGSPEDNLVNFLFRTSRFMDFIHRLVVLIKHTVLSSGSVSVFNVISGEI